MTKSIISKLTLRTFIILMGIALLAGSLGVWWSYVYNSPTSVFNRMLRVNLSTPSVTKTVVLADESQKLVQKTALETKPKQLVNSINILQRLSGEGSTVTTETISTPKADYVRFTDIKTTQKKPDGSPLNFKEVLGVWGKSDQNDPSGAAQLFNQMALGIVPIGNLSLSQRDRLLNQIKSSGVYKIDSNSVKRSRINNRPVYVYDVSVAPQAYIAMLKTFARDLGILQLEQIDPSQYGGGEAIKFRFTVDVWTGQLKKIDYMDSGRAETFSAYGARSDVVLPTSSIPAQELQGRVQQIR